MNTLIHQYLQHHQHHRITSMSSDVYVKYQYVLRCVNRAFFSSFYFVLCIRTSFTCLISCVCFVCVYMFNFFIGVIVNVPSYSRICRSYWTQLHVAVSVTYLIYPTRFYWCYYTATDTTSYCWCYSKFSSLFALILRCSLFGKEIWHAFFNHMEYTHTHTKILDSQPSSQVS